MRLVCLFLVASLTASFAFAQSYKAILTQYPEAQQMQIGIGTTNVYADPTIRSEIVATFAEDDYVLAYALAGPYYKVARPEHGHVGYIKVVHLVGSSGEAPPPTKQAPPPQPLPEPEPAMQEPAPEPMQQKAAPISFPKVQAPPAEPGNAPAKVEPTASLLKSQAFLSLATGYAGLDDMTGLGTTFSFGIRHGRFLSHLRLADLTFATDTPNDQYYLARFPNGDLRCRHRNNGNFLDASLCTTARMHFAAALDVNYLVLQGRRLSFFGGGGLRVSDRAEPYAQGGLILGSLDGFSLFLSASAGERMVQAGGGISLGLGGR